MSQSILENQNENENEMTKIAASVCQQLSENFSYDDMLFISASIINMILIIGYSHDKEHLDHLIDELPNLIRAGKNYKKLSQ